jgi:trimethylamine--corrinoid protein Co-methyltransferase
MDEENMALDIIDKVGPGGQYLSEEHTYKHFRDFWQPNIFDRSVMQKGELGGPTLSEKLNKKAIEVIENHEVPPLEKEKVDQLLELEKKWLE